MQTSSRYLSIRSFKGFTLTELLVTISIIAILAALIMPVLGMVRKTAKRTSSLANLRIISGGISMYLLENQNKYPTLDGDVYKGSNHTPYWTEKTKIGKYLPPPMPGFGPDGHTVFSASAVMMDPLVPMGYHHNLGDYGANDLVFTYTAQPSPWVPGSSPQSMKSSLIVTNPSRCVIVTTSGQPAVKGKTCYGSWALFTSAFINSAQLPSPTVATAVPDDRQTGAILSLFADGHTEAIPVDEFNANKKSLLTP